MFAAKFKTKEIADSFKEAFEKCVKALNETPPAETVKPQPTKPGR